MRSMRSPLFQSLLALLLAICAARAAAAEDAGEIVLVRNSVRGTPPGAAERAMAVGDGVVVGLAVATGADSGTKMTFEPSGSLTLGAKTRAVIDRARIDAATGRAESGLSVLAGQIRLALGRLFRGEVSLDTPTTVVGVKGTDLTVEVDEPTGTTMVAVTEGEVLVRSKAGGEVRVRAGQRTVVAPGQAPTPPSPIEPGSSTLSASAGGPAFTPPQETGFSDTPLVGVDGRVVVEPMQRDPQGGRPNG